MISRRALLGGVALGFVPAFDSGDGLELEAIAAEKMPHRVVVHGVEFAPIFEVRDYGTGWGEIRDGLMGMGLRVVAEDRGRVWFAFESLAERERVWRSRGCFGAPVLELAVYKTVSRGGREEGLQG